MHAVDVAVVGKLEMMLMMVMIVVMMLTRMYLIEITRAIMIVR